MLCYNSASWIYIVLLNERRKAHAAPPKTVGFQTMIRFLEECMAEEKREGPFYTGMYTHIDKAGGYSLTLPTDWHKIPLRKKIVGMMFSPYPDDINTSILAQKHILKYRVETDDLILLRDSFEAGIKALPGVEIEKFDATYSDSVNLFDAIYTFTEGEARRKRWTRNIYWAEAQLVIVAQGRTPEDYEYWLPMFFNTITTCKIL